MHRLIVRTDAVAHFQQQGDRVLGHRVRAVFGHVADRDRPRRRGGGVDNVVSRSGDADELQSLELPQRLRRKRRLVRQHDVRRRCSLDDLIGWRAVVNGQVAQRAEGVERIGGHGEGEAVEEHDVGTFHADLPGARRSRRRSLHFVI